MITRQVSLPSQRAHEARLIEWCIDGPIEALVPEQLEIRTQIDQEYEKALADFGQAIAEGYKIIQQYPFERPVPRLIHGALGDRYEIIPAHMGEGMNYVFYKAPDLEPTLSLATPEVEEALQAYKDAVMKRVGPFPYKSPEMEKADKEYWQLRTYTAGMLARAVSKVLDPTFGEWPPVEDDRP